MKHSIPILGKDIPAIYDLQFGIVENYYSIPNWRNDIPAIHNPQFGDTRRVF